METYKSQKQIDCKKDETIKKLTEVVQHALRLSNSLPNKGSIAVKMFINSAKKVLEETT